MHYRCEIIKDARAAVQSSVEILNGAESLNESLRQSHRTSPQGTPLFLSSDDRLRLCVTHFGAVHRWAEDVLDRARQASTLVCTAQWIQLLSQS